mgnify:CR=1 FL=1
MTHKVKTVKGKNCNKRDWISDTGGYLQEMIWQ